MNFLKNTNRTVLFISIILAIVPFFWLKPGELDLGGDGSRLYFYDPINYLKNYSLYNILPFGTGIVEPHFYNLPILTVLIILKSILKSPYLLISTFNSIKLVVAFLAVYAIVKELIGKKVSIANSEIPAIFAGLFYIFSPGILGGWDRALLNHNQMFLNPLMFYLILRYFLSHNIRYLFLALITSFIFATNFAWVSAPPFFAFYPLSLLFLFLYVTIIRREKLPWKGIFVGLLLFLGLHSFHLIPTLFNLFDPGSNINIRTFSKEDISHQLDYFYGVLPLAKVSSNILYFSQIGWPSIVIPLVIIFGFLLRAKNRHFPLTGIFFLITFFLVTANITKIGVEFYERLFYIPGFGMFRNFIGQWAFVFSFFYALLFGQALAIVFPRLKPVYIKTLSLGIISIFILSAWPFINGELVNKVNFQSNNVKIAMVMDPKYEETLAFIRSLPDDGKILTSPFTDCCYQVIHGTNNGAYVGVSTIGYLTGKKDFAGYANITPFSEVFLKLAQEKDYKSIGQMLGLLNVQYIFHNSDPGIYDTTFPGYPYQHVRQYLPGDQKTYGEFVENLRGEKVFERGPYKLFSVDEASLIPHFYVAKNLVAYENTVNDWYGKTMSFFVNDKSREVRTAYIEKDISAKIPYEKSSLTKIEFERINPTKYKIKVFNAQAPYLLVFSEAFHKNWKVFVVNTQPQKSKIVQSYFNGDVEEGTHSNIFFDRNTFETVGMRSLTEENHLVINGYANAWYITPKDAGEGQNYELIVEMVGQRIFYISLALSITFLIICIFWGVKLFMPRRVWYNAFHALRTLGF